MVSQLLLDQPSKLLQTSILYKWYTTELKALLQPKELGVYMTVSRPRPSHICAFRFSSGDVARMQTVSAHNITSLIMTLVN